MSQENRSPAGTSTMEESAEIIPDVYKRFAIEAYRGFKIDKPLGYWIRYIEDYCLERGVSEENTNIVVNYFIIRVIRDLGALRIPSFNTAYDYISYILGRYFGSNSIESFEIMRSKTYRELQDIVNSKPAQKSGSSLHSQIYSRAHFRALQSRRKKQIHSSK